MARGTFGEVLRAARLLWGWDEGIECWVRVRAGGPPHRVEVRPPGLVPAPKGRRRGPAEEFVIWWDGTKSLAASSAAMRDLAPVTAPVVLWLDDEGRSTVADPREPPI